MRETSYFALEGGLDLISRAIEIPPGRVISGLNYEPHPRGYMRIDGLERYDGHPRPSDASYWILNFDVGQAAISEGDTVTGATSGASGVAMQDATVNSGSYGGSDAVGYLVLTGVSGTFQDDENLQVSAATKSVANGTATGRGAANDTDDATFLQDAIETARAQISAPSGSGPVRGVWLFNGDRYCFRDDAGATTGVMHKATTTGWQAQTLESAIGFDAGTAEFEDGETVSGGTSGATATIERVVHQSGSWGSDAAGRLIISGVSGTFQNNETLTGGTSSGSATSDGTVSAISLPAGGAYDFDNHNFYGSSDTKRMYGVNGVGRGFEWDGSVFVPVHTTLSASLDKPTHCTVHRNHLFFSYDGGTILHSSTGEPLQWEVLTGAYQFGIGEDATALAGSVSGAMTVTGENKVGVLFGDDKDNWVLKPLNDSAGAKEWTVQTIGEPIFMDNVGLRKLSTTQAFGDFSIGTISQMVEPIFRAKKEAGVTPVASVRCRTKDQYRLFWSDGTGLTVYFGRQYPEILPFDLELTVTCACSGKDSGGDEILLIGTDTGMVYEIDAGTSLDGEAVKAFLRLPFNHGGTPTRKSRFHKATIEMDGGPNTELGVTAEFSYGDPYQPPAKQQDFSVKGSGGFWNEANMNNFYWSSPVEGTAEADIDGIGTNISLAIISSAIYEKPHVLHGITMHQSARGLKR